MFSRQRPSAETVLPPEVKAREIVAGIHHDLIGHMRMFMSNTPNYVDREGLFYAADEMCTKFEGDLFEVLKSWTK